MDEGSLERRGAPRTVPFEHRAWMGWSDQGNLVVSGVRLLDISRSGIAVEAEHVPPSGRDVWFCLAPGGEDRDSVACRIVAIHSGVRGKYRLRIAFRHRCPERLWRNAVAWTRADKGHVAAMGEGPPGERRPRDQRAVIAPSTRRGRASGRR